MDRSSSPPDAETALAERWLAWLRGRRSGQPTVDDEVFDEVLEVTYDGDDLDQAWRLILAMVRLARDDELGSIGAGPLETLLREHGDALADRVDAATTDGAFRRALISVIPHGRIVAISDRVRRAHQH